MTQAQIISLSELHPAAPDAHAPLPSHVDEGNPLHHVKATLSVCVGRAVMTVGDLLKAQRDQVVPLDSGVDEPVDLLLEGRVVARGQLVAIGDRFGVRITQLPQSLKV
jgi:flagellar motor switch protein FliN